MRAVHKCRASFSSGFFVVKCLTNIGSGLDGGGRRERIFGHHAVKAAKDADDDDDKKDYSDSNYDEFSGYR